MAVTVLVYIQDNISWTIGFGIPSAAMAIAILLFLAGSPRYTHVKPTERSVRGLEPSPATKIQLKPKSTPSAWAQGRGAQTASSRAEAGYWLCQ